MITLNTLSKLPSKKKKRLGRGEGSGLGKNCGKGHKGQRKRNPGSIRIDFSGGQTKLTKTSPKFRGFQSRANLYTQELPVSVLNTFEDGTKVTLDSLKEVGLVAPNCKKARIILNGELSTKPVVEDSKIHLTKGVKSLLS